MTDSAGVQRKRRSCPIALSACRFQQTGSQTWLSSKNCSACAGPNSEAHKNVTKVIFFNLAAAAEQCQDAQGVGTSARSRPATRAGPAASRRSEGVHYPVGRLHGSSV